MAENAGTLPIARPLRASSFGTTRQRADRSGLLTDIRTAGIRRRSQPIAAVPLDRSTELIVGFAR
jgi:hypothetical protein